MGVRCVCIVDPYERRAGIIDQDYPPVEVTGGVLRLQNFEFFTQRSFTTRRELKPVLVDRRRTSSHAEARRTR
jgi:hypothetical protein